MTRNAFQDKEILNEDQNIFSEMRLAKSLMQGARFLILALAGGI